MDTQPSPPETDSQTALSVFCDHLIEIGWLAAVITTPLFFNIYTSRTFEPDKITLLRTLATVMVGAGLISALETRQLRWSAIKQLGPRPLIVAVGLFGLAYLISTAFSLSPAYSLWGSYQRVQGTYTMCSYLAIFMLLAYKLRHWQQVERLLTLMVLTSVPICLDTLFDDIFPDTLPSTLPIKTDIMPLGNLIWRGVLLGNGFPTYLCRLR